VLCAGCDDDEPWLNHARWWEQLRPPSQLAPNPSFDEVVRKETNDITKREHEPSIDLVHDGGIRFGAVLPCVKPIDNKDGVDGIFAGVGSEGLRTYVYCVSSALSQHSRTVQVEMGRRN